MTTFLQLHLLTVYPPSNPNRDDQGRPKSALYGGAPRLRLSSQSIKRAARESDAFGTLSDSLGKRTRRIAREIFRKLGDPDGRHDDAVNIVSEIVQVFGKLDKEKTNEEGMPVLATMAFITPEEEDSMVQLAQEALDGKKLATRKKMAEQILTKNGKCVDVAMFGRMLAGEKADKDSGKEKLDITHFEREAAVQVGHALTTHRALVEDDYYTAVDDLNKRDATPGAGFLGEHGFGGGVYYLYACVNCDLLLKNLAGDADLAAKSLEALAGALATATPTGKQNSHAHHPRAQYIRTERGPQQPRDLTAAFLKPVETKRDRPDLLANSIKALADMQTKFERAYGAACEDSRIMDVPAGEGSLKEICDFAAEAARIAARRDG